MANQRLYELLNLPEEEFQAGCNFADIALFNAKRGDYGPGDPQALAKERIDHAKLFLEHSFERTMEDGTVLEIRSSPLAAGGSVVTYMDVTVRHRAEEELTRHRDLLEEAVQQRTKELEEKSNQLSEALRHERQVNELQQQFVSMASHEFRTPLAIIDGAAQRLQRRKGADPDYIADKAQQVRLAVGRMLELMDSILAFGKLESGKISIQIGDCAIGDVLVECCRRQQEISKDHQIQLKTDELPETIQADRSAIEQIVTNLLSNAVKYSPDKSEITVSGYREGDNIVVSVRDSGLGIDAEDIPKMFERYFRARTSSGIAGTGIGLNLVKQLCELHGGSIRVESVKGEGSEFTVTLPVNAKASGVQAA